MAPIPRGQHLPKATETKAKPGPMPFLGHVHAEPSVGGAWATGWEVKAATQGDACKQDTSGMQASLAFRGVLQLQYLSARRVNVGRSGEWAPTPADAVGTTEGIFMKTRGKRQARTKP